MYNVIKISNFHHNFPRVKTSFFTFSMYIYGLFSLTKEMNYIDWCLKNKNKEKIQLTSSIELGKFHDLILDGW